MRRYIKMRTRLKTKYKGRNFTILSLKKFYEWAVKDTTFIELYLAWKDAGMPLSLTPTVDRINHKHGYEIENMQWLTFQDNCLKAGEESKEGYEKWKKKKVKKK